MFRLTKQGGTLQAYIVEFVADYVSDLDTIPVKSCEPGSKVFIIENSSNYMLGTDRTWHKISTDSSCCCGSGGGGSGSGGGDINAYSVSYKNTNVGAVLDSLTESLYFNSYKEFPAIGKTKTLYVATDENKLYLFNQDTLSYIDITGTKIEDIKVIQSIL